MAIGRLRDRVTFKRRAKTTDNKGGYTTSASTLYTGWADVKPMQPDRQLQYAQVVNKQMFEVRTRHREDYTLDAKTDFFTYNSDDYLIHSILNENNMNRYLTLIAYK